MKSIVIGLFLALSSIPSFAKMTVQESQFDSVGNKANFWTFINNVNEGDVVLLGEQHGFYFHHRNQAKVIEALIQRGLSVSVGIEHIDYTKQAILDEFTLGDIEEEEFFKKIGRAPADIKDCYMYTELKGILDPYTAAPFDCWLDQLLMPEKLTSFGKALALNLPRSITGQVYKGGLKSLPADMLKLLPPNFEVGRDIYFERFSEWMNSGGHGQLKPEQLEKMFIAQSLWDDTMAWQSVKYLAINPRHVLVAMVGDFHATYGGGLKDRILARNPDLQVWAMSQNFGEKEEKSNILESVLPHSVYGERADLNVFFNMLEWTP